MRSKTCIHATIVILLVLSPFFNPLMGQTKEQKLEATILQNDSLFWNAYNNCNSDKLRQFFTDDIEFYHDKGGLTKGKDDLISSVKKNLCSGNFRLKRTVVAGSIRIFPLEKSDKIYGAIISGEHLFYILEEGKKERLDGSAKFTHIWMLSDGVWKLSRVLSYDHRPMAYVNTRKEVKVSSKVLNQYIGKYEGRITGTLTIQAEQKSLILVVKGEKFNLYPYADNLFFFKDRDITFEFTKDGNSNFYKMIVRENGEFSEELKSVK